MIVVQDRNPRGEIKMCLKNGGERIPKMKDAEVLTDVDIATRDMVRKEGAELTCVGGGWDCRDAYDNRKVA